MNGVREMTFPNTIDLNTIKCYEIKEEFYCTDSRIKCQNFKKWCRSYPNTLKELCIQSIANNWKDNPLLDEIRSPEDKCMLLNILPLNLPLDLTVPIIKDNIYWKKCALERWPHLMPMNISENNMFVFNKPIAQRKISESLERDDVSETLNMSENYAISDHSSDVDEYFTNKKSWKQFYLENYMRELLEEMEPEEYNPEEMKIMCDICSPFLYSLKIEELKSPCREEGARIPIGSVLSGLPLLQELSICFKQKYIGFEKFSLITIRLPLNEIQNFAKGLEKIKLRILRLINSDIDGDNCIPILMSLRKCHNLRVLDFSYCNLSNQGTITVCKFVKDANIKELLLTDNNIGETGAEAIAYILQSRGCTLEFLNIKMNPIGIKNGNLILKALLFNSSLKILNMSACNVKVEEVVAEVLSRCSSLQELNLSNNIIGNDIGNMILNKISQNKTLKKLDLRMSHIHSELQLKINNRIREGTRTNVFIVQEESDMDKEFSEELKRKFHSNWLE